MADYIDFDYKMEKDMYGEINFKYDKEAVQQSMIDIIMTKLGEREFMPTYGSKIYWLLFEPMNVITQMNIRDEIDNALKNWEPRIQIQDIEVIPNRNNNRYDVNIKYKVIRLNEEDYLTVELNRIG